MTIFQKYNYDPQNSKLDIPLTFQSPPGEHATGFLFFFIRSGSNRHRNASTHTHTHTTSFHRSILSTDEVEWTGAEKTNAHLHKEDTHSLTSPTPQHRWARPGSELHPWAPLDNGTKMSGRRILNSVKCEGCQYLSWILTFDNIYFVRHESANDCIREKKSKWVSRMHHMIDFRYELFPPFVLILLPYSNSTHNA